MTEKKQADRKKEGRPSKGTSKYRKAATGVIYAALRIALVCLIAVVFYIGVTKAYTLGYDIFSDEAKNREPGISLEITIVDGQSPFKIGQTLEEKGIIENGLAFGMQCMVYDTELYPGTYTVTSAMSSKEIMNLMGTDPLNQSVQQ